ncbi:MAG TPA: Ku protein [Polyangiaceae bacterium]|nr:Ku protein [Polyangiaceae bacterium]
MPEPDAIEQPADEDTAQPRAFWSGTLTFGLVSIPVDLLPATRPVVRGLRLLGNAGRTVQRHYYCPKDDQEVPQEHIVRGYETSAGQYVVVSDEELEALDPAKSREIDLRLFVPEASVHPVYFERAYFLVPSADSGKAYALLARALQTHARAGIATFVMRERAHWVAIFAMNGLLRAETLRFAEYVRSAASIGLPKVAQPPVERVRDFRKRVAALQLEKLPTAELTDEHTERIAELAARKAKLGKDVVHPPAHAAPERSQGNVIDLMDVLKQRLSESGFDLQRTDETESAPHVPSENADARAHATRSRPKPGLRRTSAKPSKQGTKTEKRARSK